MASSKTSSRKIEEDLANVEFETSEDVEVRISPLWNAPYPVPHLTILSRSGGPLAADPPPLSDFGIAAASAAVKPKKGKGGVLGYFTVLGFLIFLK